MSGYSTGKNSTKCKGAGPTVKEHGCANTEENASAGAGAGPEAHRTRQSAQKKKKKNRENERGRGAEGRAQTREEPARNQIEQENPAEDGPEQPKTAQDSSRQVRDTKCHIGSVFSSRSRNTAQHSNLQDRNEETRPNTLSYLPTKFYIGTTTTPFGPFISFRFHIFFLFTDFWVRDQFSLSRTCSSSNSTTSFLGRTSVKRDAESSISYHLTSSRTQRMRQTSSVPRLRSRLRSRYLLSRAWPKPYAKGYATLAVGSPHLQLLPPARAHGRRSPPHTHVAKCKL
jgi:hypothetical protein